MKQRCTECRGLKMQARRVAEDEWDEEWCDACNGSGTEETNETTDTKGNTK